MLVNVKFYKIFSIFVILSVNLSADEKDQIVTQLNNLNSLEFTFDQVVNDKIEKGSCLLEFPGKLKCDYFDDKKKEFFEYIDANWEGDNEKAEDTAAADTLVPNGEKKKKDLAASNCS